MTFDELKEAAKQYAAESGKTDGVIGLIIRIEDGTVTYNPPDEVLDQLGLGVKPGEPTIIAHCPTCLRDRLHKQVFHRTKRFATRNLVCTVCQSKQPVGVTCPKCGDCRLKTYRTIHDGIATIRKKVCKNPRCCNKVRTREVVASD